MGRPQGHLVPSVYARYVPLARKRAIGVAVLVPAATGPDALLHPCVSATSELPVQGRGEGELPLRPGEETEGAAGWVREVACLGVA